MVASIPDREMSLGANVTVVSWENAVSLRKELHQRELAAVAEEITSVLQLLPQNLRDRVDIITAVPGLSEVCVRVDGIIVHDRLWGRRAAP